MVLVRWLIVVDHSEVAVVRLVAHEKRLTSRDGEREVGVCVIGLVSAISFLIQLLHHLCLPGFVMPCDKSLKAQVSIKD